jgi:LysM repeat protein
MKAWQQLGSGFLLGTLSIGLVLGAFALAMAEGGLIPPLAARPSPTPIPQSAYPTLELLPPLVDAASPTEDSPETPTPTLTSTLPPPPTACLPPRNWVAIIVQPFDSLTSLARTYDITERQLMDANCLVSTELVSGSILYVPRWTNITQVVCSPRTDWALYTVRPGDTLYRLSLLYRVSVSELQQGNCLGASSAIYSGQRLRVPNVATSTATFTPIPPATATGTVTPTVTIDLTAQTPSPTPDSNTPTPVPDTPTATTPTPTEPASPTPFNTPSPAPAQ